MIAKELIRGLQDELNEFDLAIVNRTEKDDLESPIITSATKIVLLLAVLFETDEFKKLKSLGLI